MNAVLNMVLIALEKPITQPKATKKPATRTRQTKPSAPTAFFSFFPPQASFTPCGGSFSKTCATAPAATAASAAATS